MKNVLLSVLMGTTLLGTPLFAGGIQDTEGDDELSMHAVAKLMRLRENDRFSFNKTFEANEDNYIFKDIPHGYGNDAVNPERVFEITLKNSGGHYQKLCDYIQEVGRSSELNTNLKAKWLADSEEWRLKIPTYLFGKSGVVGGEALGTASEFEVRFKELSTYAKVEAVEAMEAKQKALEMERKARKAAKQKERTSLLETIMQLQLNQQNQVVAVQQEKEALLGTIAQLRSDQRIQAMTVQKAAESVKALECQLRIFQCRQENQGKMMQETLGAMQTEIETLKQTLPVAQPPVSVQAPEAATKVWAIHSNDFSFPPLDAMQTEMEPLKQTLPVAQSPVSVQTPEAAPKVWAIHSNDFSFPPLDAMQTEMEPLKQTLPVAQSPVSVQAPEAATKVWAIHSNDFSYSPQKIKHSQNFLAPDKK